MLNRGKRGCHQKICNRPLERRRENNLRENMTAKDLKNE